VLLPQNDERSCGTSVGRRIITALPWLGERSGRISMLRGTMSPEHGRGRRGEKDRIELELRGLHKEPVGIDIVSCRSVCAAA